MEVKRTEAKLQTERKLVLVSVHIQKSGGLIQLTDDRFFAERRLVLTISPVQTPNCADLVGIEWWSRSAVSRREAGLYQPVNHWAETLSSARISHWRRIQRSSSFERFWIIHIHRCYSKFSLFSRWKGRNPTWNWTVRKATEEYQQHRVP